MRIIIVRPRHKALARQIEFTHVCNDDVALHLAENLRSLDKRQEYFVDILIPVDQASAIEEMTTITAEVNKDE